MSQPTLFVYVKCVLIAAAPVSVLVSSYLVEYYFTQNHNVRTIPQTKLSQFNGIQNKELYLAVIGSIFNVTKSKSHYEKGRSYHFFVGKDATRSLVTGDFQDSSEKRDHILDLKCDDLFAIINWKQTFRKKYLYVGKLEGRYYNKDGTETQYMLKFKTRLKDCRIEKEKSKQQDILYPPCNVGWSETEGTRVWCSKLSGGVSREWVGYPRQLYTPGSSKPKCICVKEDQNTNMIKQYNKCQADSHQCILLDV
ncbi:neuferricin homolog [Leptidea sinapis]|uniref:neuferricin homolog n=1 Tax=Leptidea sinapis TaxID=189913 RepID=UPI00213BA560|nr:neuferricin homolog [Leptidea sinapis]